MHISNSENISFHPDDLNNFQSPGTYIQNFKGKITIGHGSYIGPNVGIITANHDLHNLDAHLPGRDVTVGERCWIGMNTVVLPGVVLGDGTIVGAGSVVTRPFPDGNCVIAGNPARLVRKL
jgi:acetyltransferase-like isoleucine patch superfamily enzyme